MENQGLDDDAAMCHRARAKAELEQIARQTQQALVGAGIDLSLFFLVPSSGNSVITFGTPADPPDDEWNRVGTQRTFHVSVRLRLLFREALSKGLERFGCCVTQWDKHWSRRLIVYLLHR